MNKEFWKAAVNRSIRTICQTAIAMIGTTAVGVSDVNWKVVLSASILAGLLSILNSIATGLPEAQYAEHIYMSAEEPVDSEVDEFDAFDDDYFIDEEESYGEE